MLVESKTTKRHNQIIRNGLNNMFDLDSFISKYVIRRTRSMFAADLEANKSRLFQEIQGKSVCVIGGAGSIGSAYIKSILHYSPAKLVVVDLSENGLAELTRDLRSSVGIEVPADYRTYTLDYSSPIFESLFLDEQGFDIVANFSAHKHVRSERDHYSVRALLENNDFKAKRLMELLMKYKPQHFFCVSTDKAANPVNIMGASKRILEDIIMSYSDHFTVTTARFANVAFSSGSLPDSWLHRLQKKQPLVAPNDVKRYFVSPEESGHICLLASILGRSGDIFFPKLGEEQMMSFSEICDDFMREQGLKTHICSTEQEAKQYVGEDYPVIYSRSNTTGEKAIEEFYTEGEEPNYSRFNSLGVLRSKQKSSLNKVETLLSELEKAFSSPSYSKADIVAIIKNYLPNFEHTELNRNLDQKM